MAAPPLAGAEGNSMRKTMIFTLILAAPLLLMFVAWEVGLR